MVPLFWIVPVLVSALLIWLIAAFLSPNPDFVTMGKAVWTALLMAIANLVCFVFLRPTVGNVVVTIAAVVGLLIIWGILRLGFLRSLILLVVYYGIMGAGAYFIAHYHHA
jgi:hypothetical protein